MCGIVGALSFNDFKITPDYLNKMRDKLVHRGPDGANTWIGDNGHVGLGHQRLAIIDRSEWASQPMSNHDKTLWLCFNGEIYNHEEIRQELNRVGAFTWKTSHSDTEVLLHAFQHWGIGCLQYFRGMYAFALWDQRAQALWLVRDRLGIKPLYYSFHHNRLTFASEIKALLADPDQKRAINEEGLFHYLSFLTTPAPQTLFKDIYKLPPATYLRIDANGTTQQETYWDVYDHTTPLTHASEADVAERILAELKTSVQLRTVSDVPVGVFLSGGIDSSTNACLLSQHTQQPIHTFSIGYQGNHPSYPSELPFARTIAEKIGSQHHEYLMSMDDLIDFLPQMVSLQDEPIADPVCVPVYFVSKMAREQGIIVCQVGEGADELFWGYPSWKIKLRLQHLSQIRGTHSMQKLALHGLRLMGKKQSLQYELLRRGTLKQPIFWGGAEAFTESQKRHLLSDTFSQRFKDHSSFAAIEPIYQRFLEKTWDPHWLNWMSYLDLNFRLPELLLMRVDKMTMGASIEGRVPFLDHKFVELAMSIPASMKTTDGVLKYILKKSVQGVIPDEIIHRKKQGFGVPIYEWLFDKLGAYARDKIKTFCAQTDFLNEQAVDGLFEKHRGAQIWYLLNLALWWEEFM